MFYHERGRLRKRGEGGEWAVLNSFWRNWWDYWTQTWLQERHEKNQAESGFTPPLDLWKGKIGGEVAALGAVLVVVSVGLPFRRDQSKKNSKPLIPEGGLPLEGVVELRSTGHPGGAVPRGVNLTT